MDNRQLKKKDVRVSTGSASVSAMDDDDSHGSVVIAKGDADRYRSLLKRYADSSVDAFRKIEVSKKEITAKVQTVEDKIKMLNEKSSNLERMKCDMEKERKNSTVMMWNACVKGQQSRMVAHLAIDMLETSVAAMAKTVTVLRNLVKEDNSSKLGTSDNQQNGLDIEAILDYLNEAGRNCKPVDTTSNEVGQDNHGDEQTSTPRGQSRKLSRNSINVKTGGKRSVIGKKINSKAALTKSVKELPPKRVHADIVDVDSPTHNSSINRRSKKTKVLESSEDESAEDDPGHEHRNAVKGDECADQFKQSE